MDKALNSSSVWQTKILPVMWTHVVARPSCAARCCLVSVHFNVRISVYVQKHARLFIQKYGNYELSVSHFGAKVFILIKLFVVLVAVLHFAGWYVW